MVDTEDRYVFIKGLIGDVRVTIATIYAPNDRQDTFIHCVLSKLTDFAEGQVIIGEDFNIHPNLPPWTRRPAFPQYALASTNELHKTLTRPNS